MQISVCFIVGSLTWHTRISLTQKQSQLFRVADLSISIPKESSYQQVTLRSQLGGSSLAPIHQSRARIGPRSSTNYSRSSTARKSPNVDLDKLNPKLSLPQTVIESECSVYYDQ